VKGEVSVLPLSEVPSRFEPGSTMFAGPSGEHALVVGASRRHQRKLLVAFEGVGDRTAAEALAGQYLFVPADQIPSLPEGSYWPHELIGCEVATEAGRSLGRVREVAHTQANDVWITEGDGGEVLVPALREVVASVDVAGRRIVVREVPGLTAP
jgi:16S rRNA processing protein RimM